MVLRCPLYDIPSAAGEYQDRGGWLVRRLTGMVSEFGAQSRGGSWGWETVQSDAIAPFLLNRFGFRRLQLGLKEFQ